MTTLLIKIGDSISGSYKHGDIVEVVRNKTISGTASKIFLNIGIDTSSLNDDEFFEFRNNLTQAEYEQTTENTYKIKNIRKYFFDVNSSNIFTDEEKYEIYSLAEQADCGLLIDLSNYNKTSSVLSLECIFQDIINKVSYKNLINESLKKPYIPIGDRII